MGSSSSVLTIQSRSEIAYGSSLLPSGLSTSNYSITGGVLVYDALLAFANAYYPVSVAPVVLSSTELSNLILNQLSIGSGNANAMKQAIAVSSSMVNIVNCSAAPNCTQLHRSECMQSANTCSSCISGYIGDDGDANTACKLTANANNSSADSSCVTDDDCGLWSACNVTAHKCYRLPKVCNCFGHGECIYTVLGSNATVDSCLQGDLTCNSKCICEVPYVGADCSLTSEELEAKQTLRTALISSLVSSVTNDNPSAENVKGWSNAVASMTQVPNEVSTNSSIDILNIVSYSLENAVSLGSASTDLTGNVNALNSIAQVAPISGVSNLVKSFGNIMAGEMVTGQPPAAIVQSSFRLSTSIASSSIGFNLSTPITPAELLSGMQPTSVSLPSTGSGVSVLAVLMDASLYNNSNFNSNPFHLTMDQMPCESSECFLTFTLQNNFPVPVKYSLSNDEAESFITTCIYARPGPVIHTCSNGNVISEYCNGSYGGSYVSYCTTNFSVSVCNSLASDNSVGGSGCSVVNYTATGPVCSCPIAAHSSHRRLTTGNKSSISVSFVSMLSSVAQNFENTWMSADKLTASSVLQGVQVLVTTGMIGIIALIAMALGVYADSQSDVIHVVGSDKVKNYKNLSRADRNRRQINLVKEAIQSTKVKMTTEELIIKSSLPQAMHDEPLTTKLTNEIKNNHKWLSVIYYSSKYFPRLLRVLSLTTGVISMLFMQALIYPLAHPDNGSCELAVTQAACLSQPSPFSAGASKCYWTFDQFDVAYGGHCYFNPPGNSMGNYI